MRRARRDARTTARATFPIVATSTPRTPSVPATHLTLAVVSMLGAMFVMPLLDGLAKYLQGSYPTGQVVWARYTFHLLVMLPLLASRFGLRSLWPNRPGEQLLRGSLLLSATVLFFSSIRVLPLADSLALFFVSPLLVTVLAAVMLREPVGWRRIVAVLVGLVGVAILLRPGSSLFSAAAFLALGAGAVHALYMVITRRLAGSDPPLVTLAHTALVGTVGSSLVVSLWWVPPTLRDWGLMIAMGAFAATGHFLIIKAFDHAPAAWLAPVGYAEIIMSTAVGYAFFGDFPDPATWLGMTVIVASGLYISLRERRRYRSFRPGA